MASKARTKGKNKFITIRVEQNLLKQVEKVAKQRGVEKSNLIRQAIQNYFGDKTLLDLPPGIKEQLDRLSRETGIPGDQIVIEAVHKYLWRVRADRVREKLVPAARQKGIVTEEDVFRRIS